MNEVRSQSVLRLFGCLLAFTHILTCLFWLKGGVDYVAALTDALPLCWPFLDGCESWGRLTPQALFAIFTLYTLVAGFSALLFLNPKWTRPAYFLLGLASLIKLFVFLLDYRLSGNYHYMHFWVLAAYFFVTQKALSIRFLLLAFYLGAGVLKLNPEWLSGAVFPEGIFLHGAALEAACAYVVALELFLVFGLLAKPRWIFWATLAQLFVFHAVSFLIVGFYYPSLFFCFLALFVLCERESRGDFHWRRLKDLEWSGRLLLGLFVILQVIPWILGGDRAIDGRGRLLSLSMFDARPVCEMRLVARYGERSEMLIPRYVANLDPRLSCDPHVMLADARHRCRELSTQSGFSGLDISLKSRRQTGAEMHEVFAFEDFCARPKRVNVLGLIRDQ